MIIHDTYNLFVDYFAKISDKHYKFFIESLNNFDREGVTNSHFTTNDNRIINKGNRLMGIFSKLVFQGKFWTHDNGEHFFIKLGTCL